MPTQKKNETIDQIRAKLGVAKAMIFTDFTGVSVEQISTLRRKLRDCKAEYRIYKNTLTRIALQDKPYAAELTKHLEGTTAVLVSDDAVGPLKILKEFERTKNIPIKIGIIDGFAFDPKQLQAIRELPALPQMRGMLLGLLQSPARGFLTLLNAAPRNLLSVLKQKAEAGEKAA